MNLPPYLDADGRLVHPTVPEAWEQFEVMDEDGVYRMGGLLPRELPRGSGLIPTAPSWFKTGEDVPPLPRSEWRSTPDMKPYEWNNRYQGNYPACCNCALVGTVEFLMARDGLARSPLDWHKFWIETTGGRGGCAVDRAVQHAMQKGMPVKGSVTERVFVEEAWDVGTRDDFAIGLQRGGIGLGCHDVHAECVVGLNVDRPKPTVWMVNSHYYGENAAKNWHEFLLERIELERYGAFVVRSARLRSVDVDGLIDAKG